MNKIGENETKITFIADKDLTKDIDDFDMGNACCIVCHAEFDADGNKICHCCDIL